MESVTGLAMSNWLHSLQFRLIIGFVSVLALALAGVGFYASYATQKELDAACTCRNRNHLPPVLAELRQKVRIHIEVFIPGPGTRINLVVGRDPHGTILDLAIDLSDIVRGSCAEFGVDIIIQNVQILHLVRLSVSTPTQPKGRHFVQSQERGESGTHHRLIGKAVVIDAPTGLRQ